MPPVSVLRWLSVTWPLQLLGSDSATLSAQLERKPEAGSQDTTQTGLRLDQAAAIWAALTNRQPPPC